MMREQRIQSYLTVRMTFVDSKLEIKQTAVNPTTEVDIQNTKSNALAIVHVQTVELSTCPM